MRWRHQLRGAHKTVPVANSETAWCVLLLANHANRSAAQAAAKHVGSGLSDYRVIRVRDADGARGCLAPPPPSLTSLAPASGAQLALSRSPPRRASACHCGRRGGARQREGHERLARARAGLADRGAGARQARGQGLPCAYAPRAEFPPHLRAGARGLGHQLRILQRVGGPAQPKLRVLVLILQHAPLTPWVNHGSRYRFGKSTCANVNC